MITGVLLAAGRSQRYGADKLLQPLPDGLGVAAHACRNLLSGVDQVIAVVKPDSDQLTEQLQMAGARIVICEDADQGMGRSLASGIAASSASAGWLVALADMPWIAPTTIADLAAALRNGASIVAPTYHGQRGHPVGFAQVWRDELQALQGDRGARSIIQMHAAFLQLVPCDDAQICNDIDTPEDWYSFLNRSPYV